MEQVCDNAYKQYIKSRPAASSESIKRVKELHISEAGLIPEYSDISSNTRNLLSKITSYRPQGVRILFKLVHILLQSYRLRCVMI